VGGIMATIYMGRCTKTEAELQAALGAETYLSADEALEWGFVTEVVVAEQAAAACDIAVFEAVGFHPDPAYRSAIILAATPMLGRGYQWGGAPPVPALGDAGRNMKTQQEMASLFTAAKRH